ncbi:MAG: lipid IV(A) 3-deoxy-D-manno-octulosonic acid transferase [Burkholderiales bacterium]|nr:lipid IV(A) 3-deoxy-D-manno-octulosonic acid transferase [Burkholderiales bacterium]
MNRFFYTLILRALFPLVLARLLLRGWRQRAYRFHIPERFGFYGPVPEGKVIWLHAVSVGETRAAAPLIAKLAQACPGHPILITHMTPTGRETGERLYGEFASICYLPYDYPFAVKRFLKHFKPEIGLLMETELWFNLIHLCKKNDVPLFLVNARLSEKSLKRYARFPKLAKQSLNDLAAIAAQTGGDAARLEKLGAGNVSVCGNLKFDVHPPENIADFRAFFDKRPVFLAASTREGEEALLLDAFGEDLLLVIVPRHPQRFMEVENLLRSKGIAYAKRSENKSITPDERVFLGDSMGEMFSYYASCDCAYIGGSLLPFGGQNLIEAASLGKPVFIGPYTYNFDEAARLALEAGAAIRVENAVELAKAAGMLLEDPERLAEMGRAGLKFAESNRGAAQKIMALIAPVLNR